MKKIVLLTLCALSLFGFAACKKAPSFFEKTGYEAVSNRVLSECVVKEGDLYYRYVNGERTGEGYTSLTAANSLYTVYAYLENPTLTLYNSYLAQKQNGAWVFIHSGEELLLPEGGEWSFTMPYLAGKKTQTLTDENGKTRYKLFTFTTEAAPFSATADPIVISGASVTASASITDNTGLNNKIKAMLVVYDGEGKIAKVTAQDMTLAAGVNSINLTATAPAAARAKLYIWGGFNGMSNIILAQ